MRKASVLRLLFIPAVLTAVAVMVLVPGLACRSKRPSAPVGDETTVHNHAVSAEEFAGWLERDFSPERELLSSIRHALVNHTRVDELPSGLNVDLERKCAWVSITLFEGGIEQIRWITKRRTGLESINRAVERLRKYERFSEFHVADADMCRIMLEVITEEHPLDIGRLNVSRFDKNRFEPGITGFKLIYEGKTYLYMPTEAAVYGHMTIAQALNHISKKVGVAKQTNKISKRVKILTKLPIEWSVIKSVAFISYGEDVLPLYRGYPVPVKVSRDKLFELTGRAARWLYDNMDEDGRFLYYYDGVRDSIIDHAHPKRTEEDNYYNILRHSGGVLALLRAYELTGRDEYLVAADKAIGYLVKQTREHAYQGRKAYYVFYNQKAKLGGTGVGLVAILRYRQITKDTKYDDYIFGMANHLLSRIDEDGEMIGYYIHPGFNNGQPLISPSPEQKRQLFSFYYPGEALLGLALFEREMPLSEEMRREVRDDAKRALDFLIFVRPVRYADMFEPLPSDGWLMQAIEEWSAEPEFQKSEYLDFVFNDANQMISHMYNDDNSPYYDYPGGFYYHYGDHVYVDSARAEGLIAAYYLAKRVGRERLAENLLDSCKLVARSLMYSYNSKESTYMHKFPDKSVGTFRFKLTRHWVRVDTAQHAICFFVRLLSAMQVGESQD